MTQPDSRPSPETERSGAPAPADPVARRSAEHVRTDAEVRVDDELGTGDNRH